jgi:hypothetical protein
MRYAVTRPEPLLTSATHRSIGKRSAGSISAFTDGVVIDFDTILQLGSNA